jgi:hypothetical protein
LLSFIDNGELENLASAEEKKRRHDIRITSIVCYLKDKLIQFPAEQAEREGKSSQFITSLYEEAYKLSAEPNGQKLLSTLGKIYVDEAKAYLYEPSTEVTGVICLLPKMIKSNYISELLEFFLTCFLGYLTSLTKNRSNLEEVI